MDLTGSLRTFRHAPGCQFLRASRAAVRDDYFIRSSHTTPIWLDYDSEMVPHNRGTLNGAYKFAAPQHEILFTNLGKPLHCVTSLLALTWFFVIGLSQGSVHRRDPCSGQWGERSAAFFLKAIVIPTQTAPLTWREKFSYGVADMGFNLSLIHI